MNASRINGVYENDVEEFMQLVKRNKEGVNGCYYCLCVIFLNERWLEISLI